MDRCCASSCLRQAHHMPMHNAAIATKIGQKYSGIVMA